MAASIYATPPPDLSSEDTALSDVSNTSSTTNNATTAETTTATVTLKQLTSPTTTTNKNITNNSCEETLLKSTASLLDTTSTTTATQFASNNNNNKETRRTIPDVNKDTSKPNDTSPTQCSSNFPHTGSSTNVAHYNQNDANDDNNQPQQKTTATTMVAVAAAANAAMQLQLLEAINDAAKKRRKQNNPSRMDEDTTTTNSSNSLNQTVDFEDKLSKMFLPKSMEQLKETFDLLQQEQNLENISKTQELNDKEEQQHQQVFNNPYHTYCKECGENFENEFKLSLHMLQEHSEGSSNFTNHQSPASSMMPMDILASVKVKSERTECESPSSNHNLDQNPGIQDQNHLQKNTNSTNGKNHHNQAQQQTQWMRSPAMSTMGFPFPPEAAAAAAFQAGGYLPLLGVPGFPSVDGLNRPPLRIFNPEAFCELCNKEFCNKYFLKTHKANKHGIYDPISDNLATSQQQPQSSMHTMNQMFQLQIQQQHHHLQQHQQQQQMHMELAQQKMVNEHQSPDNENSLAAITSSSNTITKATYASNNAQTQVTPSAQVSVFCDICSKRFTNIFAMRRHRAKTHEQNSNNNSQRNSPSAMSGNSMDSTVPSSEILDLPKEKPFQMPEGFRQDFVLEQEEVSFTPQPRKLSPQLQQQAREANFAHDKLKRLGVTNPESFCEICCKEYCSKYFLRTHKWKRHGIIMPPEETESTQKQPPWPFINMAGMPVNFMMAQRMMQGTETDKDKDTSQQLNKRIKLEQPDEDQVIKDVNNDENQENRSENNQVLSVPSTPEPSKLVNESHNLAQSPETTMGLQNLQKLQTMIQQLNDLNSKRPIACHFCGRELDNQYALQAHIIAEHNGGLEGSISALNFPSQFLMQQQALLKQSPSGSPSSLMPLMNMAGSGELRCTPCEKEYTNLSEFQKHIAEVHLLTNNPDSPLREGFVTPERPINSSLTQNTRPPYTITPTSSYCEICNKELCNKYFMKTHMQRMHGIEIENGAQIGGVVCNICNKELCSKYFLRVHKHNTHGIIEDGAPLPTPRQNGLNLETLQQQIMESDGGLNRNLNMSPFGSGESEGKNESYSAPSYTEICTICTRRFRNAKWLRNHLISEHGSTGIEKVRELEQECGGSLSKPTSPTLKISNGSSSTGSSATTPSAVPSPAQLAQALQNLNAQHLLQNMPKKNMPSTFNSEPNQQLPQLKEYQCSMCPFVTPYYAFLFIHERTHSIINTNEWPQEKEQCDQAKYKPKKIEEQKEEQSHYGEGNKSLKRKSTCNLKTSTETITLDEEDFEDQAEDIPHDSNSRKQQKNEPTNLSMRTPSPTDITSNKTLKDLQKTPHTLLNEEFSISDNKEFRHSSISPKTFRSEACSPIFKNPQKQQQLLQEISQQYGKPASFAVPQHDEPLSAQMQAFVIEAIPQNDDTDVSSRFIPAIVYLPVKEPLTGTKKLSFNLTPI